MSGIQESVFCFFGESEAAAGLIIEHVFDENSVFYQFGETEATRNLLNHNS